MKCPDNFLWGGAVTAHQSEGAYEKGGKVPAVCDLTPTGEYSDFKDGIDSYHRYEEDFDFFIGNLRNGNYGICHRSQRLQQVLSKLASTNATAYSSFHS